MKYNELNVIAARQPKRVGRGIAAGRGKTAGRGTKGQKARTGSSAKPGFEGGQNPLMQRLPKLRGFTSHHEAVVNVYTGQLSTVEAKTVDAAALAAAGLLPNQHVVAKLIVRGDITVAKDVKLPKASKTAVAALEKAGGSFTVAERVARPKTRADRKPKA